MNIIKVQQTFKRLPDEKVAEYVRDPALGFIALMELNERKKERDAYQAQSQQPDVSLAESIPQELGIMSGAAPSAPPPTMPAIQPQPMQPPMEQPVGMAGGGIVAFSNGGLTPEFAGMLEISPQQIEEDRERVRRELERRGSSPTEATKAYLEGRSLTEERPKPPQAEQAQIRKTEPVVQVPTRTTTPGGPTPAKPTPAGLAAIPGVPAVQSLEQMIEAAKTGGEKIGKIFPDQVSPLMEEYQKYLQGKKISEDEARREGFRQFGLKALQGTSRDFFQNIGAAGEAGMGAYKAIREKNSQIEDTVMQQKIALAQAKEARDRGNFDAAMRLNDKAQALGLQRYGLEVERAKAIDAIETGKTTRRLAEAKLQLIPAQLAALKAKAQLEGKNVVRPETYQKAYAALDSKFKTSLGNQIKDYLTKKQGSSYLQTEEGQKEYNSIYNTKVRAAVLESLGLPPNTEVGSSYVRRSKAYDDDE
jgi:hypothetical protein